MSSVLYLTADEKKVFDGLSKTVREGWTVEEETSDISDTAEQMSMRMELMRFEDPSLAAFQSKVSGAASLEDLATLIQQTDLSDVNEDSLAELFFALGPVVLTRLIGPLLADAQTDAHVSSLEALTGIRHSLLLSR